MKRLFLTLCIALCAVSLVAQVDIDKLPIDTIDGKPMYVYSVQKSEGLYRISKNFGVSQDDIIKQNPVLQAKGLREGQVIHIPVVERIDSTQYIVHELLPKETLYGLSKRYDVNMTQIQKLNPQTSKRMAIGTRLLIAHKPAEESNTEKPIEQAVEEPKQAVEEAVEKAEEQPAIDLATLFQPQPLDSVKPDSIAIDTLVAVADTLLADSTLRPLRIAYLLPLMTDEIERKPATERFLEFYEGALLAVNGAQEEGQRFELYVFDTQKNDVRIQTILQQEELKALDAIVGPAYPSQVDYVSSFAAENQIPTLIPFTSKVDSINTNPYLLQFNPTDDMMRDTLMAYLANTLDSIQYVFVETDAKKDAASIADLKKQLKAQGLSYKMLTDSVVMHDSLPQVLHKTKTNIIVFDTDKYREAGLLLAKVEQLQNQYPMLLWSHYAWQKNVIKMPHVYTSVFKRAKLIDIDLMTYTMRFNQFFGHDLQNDSPRYDLLGYDLTTWLIQWLQNNKGDLHLQGLQSDIHFQPIHESAGSVNTAIQILRP